MGKNAVDNNCLHSLFTLRYSHMRMQLVKTIIRIQITILRNADAINNRISIPFIYNIY
jgi:hypothetical protein